MDDIFGTLRGVLVEKFEVPEHVISLETTLDELDVDSIATVEMADIMRELLGAAPLTDETLSRLSKGCTLAEVCEILREHMSS